MIDIPEIIERGPERAAVIHLLIPRSEIARAVDSALREILGVLDDQQIEPAGPWYAHHLRIDLETFDLETFDLEICVPVTRTVAPVGRVQRAEWPAMRMATAIHNGSLSGLAGAWRELDAWIGRERLAAGRDLWERYLTGRDEIRDPSKWRTELSREILD